MGGLVGGGYCMVLGIIGWLRGSYKNMWIYSITRRQR